MNISERVVALRKVMEEKGIDAYVIPTADFHQSEYVGDYFKARAYMTGFTGSAGTAVVTKEEAYLWTDGRYFVQAPKQLAGTTVGLMKMGEPDVPTINEYLEKVLPEGGKLGFDGRVVSVGGGQAYEKIVAAKNGEIVADYDLVDIIWEDRPELSKKPVYALGLEYTGKSTADKLADIRKVMEEKKASMHVLTTLDDICWILNVRGDDVQYFPLLLSYAVITKDKMDFYVDESKFTAEIKESLEKDGVVFKPYNQIYEDITKIGEGESLLFDPVTLNYRLYKNIPEHVVKVEGRNPEVLMKAMKNEVEIENIKKAQIKDSVAHVRFMKWLKENYLTEEITELNAPVKLDTLRAEMGNFIQPSFGPICAFGEHAAMCHYSASEESNVRLTDGELFLTDTGSGYWEGSTDITRTYALGEIKPEIKEHFTLVAMANLRLANAKFAYGCSGQNLDVLTRQPFWDRGIDFNHGTGHGVGYLLNIHEGPAGFAWQYRGTVQKLEEGMILTDEPGFYVEGSHGIRLENELLVRKGDKNSFGQFMYFEPITFIPMDLDAIVPEIMTDMDKKYLNAYHKNVYEKISPYLNEEEKEWLARYTREI